MNPRRGRPHRLLASLLALVVLAGMPRPAGAQRDRALEAPMSQLGAESFDRRRAAAAALSSFGGAAAVDTLAGEIAALRDGDDDALIALFHGLRHAPRDTDLVDLLAQRRPDPVVQRALATVCLTRALARIGTLAAVRQLVIVASRAGGAFRGEIFRELKELDDRATAALIEARADGPREIRAWARDALDALGKRTPGDAVQTTNDEVLVDVLWAYANARDVDALQVVLSFVNSDRTPVRAAARAATVTYGADAMAKIRSTYLALTGEKLADESEPVSAARALFAAYDRYRFREVYARLDEGLAKERAGDLDGAIADFDQVLARQPMLDRRQAMVASYLSRGEGLETTDRTSALAYLHRALRLAEGGPQSARVASEIRCVEGEDLLSRGIVDLAPFEQAVAMDPENVHVGAELERLRAHLRAGRGREARAAAAVAATGLGLVAVGIFGLLRRRGPVARAAAR